MQHAVPYTGFATTNLSAHHAMTGALRAEKTLQRDRQRRAHVRDAKR